MSKTYIPDSTAIRAIEVDDEVTDYKVKDEFGTHHLRDKHVVTVTFRDNSTHRYLLSPRMVEEFVTAESVGRYFNAAVRGGWWVTLD